MGEILYLQLIYLRFKYKSMSHIPNKLLGLSVIWTDDLLLTVQSVLWTELSTQRWIALVQPLSTCSSYHKTIRKSPYWLQFKYQFKYHWQLTFYIFLLPSSLRHKLVWLPESVSRLIFWSIVPKFKNECSKKLYDINDHYVTYVYISCTVYNRENTSEYDKVSN